MLKFASFLFLLAFITPSIATPGDTTWVSTYQEEFFNWATSHQDTFYFPTEGKDYEKVILHYRIECPSGGCDPYDRFGNLKVRVPTGIIDSSVASIDTLTGDTTWNFAERVESYEIARIITPFSIGNRSCTWQLDVTDYQFLLKGDVWMSMYISTWINGTRGWLVTTDFEFIEGAPALVPFKVVNLWNNGGVVVGDPLKPIEDFLKPLTPNIDIEADSIKLRVITTGHGQGNTQNAAEFSRLDHMIIIEGDTFSNDLWRSDCAQNLCSPQSGTWTYGRAGWCPGDKVNAWDIMEVNNYYTPGEPLIINYDLEAYENFCRPDYPCNVSQHCMSFVNGCDYDNNGHTQPNYAIETQLILYRDTIVNALPSGFSSNLRNSFMMFPNPSEGVVYISLDNARSGNYYIRIFNLTGTISFELSAAASQNDLRMDLSGLSSGIYLVEMIFEEESAVKKLLIK